MKWGSDFTVGVEEELLLIDAHTHALVDRAEEVIPRIQAPEGAAGYEAHAHEVELRSPPCATAGEAVEQLRGLRAAARDAGATLIGSGLHPDAELFDARLTHLDRYAVVLDQMRGLIQRTPECALHVHVGMPDPETAVHVFNHLRLHLPLLTALAANSPWWFGRDSGLASARWVVVRGYPRHRIPPYFHDYGHYEELVAAACAAGDLEDYTYLWWDARLHPNHGTIEIREMDSQAPLEWVAGLAGAIHSLARRAADLPPAAPVPTEALAESSFRGARDGVAATLLHDGALTPVPDIARALFGDALDPLLRAGGGAARRRADFSEGGMPALLAGLARETAA
jgi:carboxylate-amine ligase